MNKRPPSEEGEWETGCHGGDANNMALIALTHSQFYDLRMELCERWQRAMTQMQQRTLASSKEELATMSLGWLLGNAEGFYHQVAQEAATADPDDPEGTFHRLTKEDKETIRDFFCWLHRELVRDARELEIRTQYPTRPCPTKQK